MLYKINFYLITKETRGPGGCLSETFLSGMGILMLKIKRINVRAIFTIGIPYLERRSFILRRGPGSCNNIKSPSGINYVCLLLQLILVYTPCFVKSSEFSPVGRNGCGNET